MIKKSKRNLDFPKKFPLFRGIRKFTIGFPIQNFRLEKTTKFFGISKIHSIYYRISYTKINDFPNLEKIIVKSEISSRFITFCHEFFMESLQVFSYDLENSRCRQRAIQRIPYNCACNAGQMFSQFWKILGFIAWRFHIVLSFFNRYKLGLFVCFF